MAYAVIVEKYVHKTAEHVAMKILLNIPFHTGRVPARRFFQFVIS